MNENLISSDSLRNKEVCELLQQSMYDLIDLKSHIRHVSSVPKEKRNPFYKRPLSRIYGDLRREINRIMQLSIERECYVNVTTRWVAAGSNLESFPVGATEIWEKLSFLELDFQRVAKSTFESSKNLIVLNDSRILIIFTELRTSLCWHAKVIQAVKLTYTSEPMHDKKLY